MENLINLTKNCTVGSPNWMSNIKKVMETKPDNFIFYVDVFGENTLSRFLENFSNKVSVREEIIANLGFYAQYDTASIYSMLVNKGFATE